MRDEPVLMKMFYRKLEFLGQECHPEGVVSARFKAGVHQRMLSPRARKVALAAANIAPFDRAEAGASGNARWLAWLAGAK